LKKRKKGDFVLLLPKNTWREKRDIKVEGGK